MLRAYGTLVKLQQLAELEEVIMFEESDEATSELKRKEIKELWANRLQGCQMDTDVWHSILQVGFLCGACVCVVFL